MDWTHVNGIWAKSSEQDPDIPVDIPEKDPDIRTNPPERETELTENVLVRGMMITPPLKRLRKKTTPNPMHIMQNNNITVAYATPLITTTSRPITTIRHNAQITRDDLLSTSKYYQYHKAMGHTPQHIQHISGRQKNDFLLKVVFRHTCTNMSISFMTKQPGQKNKKQQMHPQGPHSCWLAGALRCEGELLWSDQQGGRWEG